MSSRPAPVGETVTASTLNHFAAFRLTEAYWAQSAHEQMSVRSRWVECLAGTADVVHHYQTFPAETTADVLVWTVTSADDAATAARFFDRYARALRPFRRFVQPAHILWGFTRPSQYSRARSRQEINPLEARTQPYLVMYPFTKTAEWYLTNRDTRQGMMNEHIRIGKQYTDITQLLVYSVGLQDQEFVVVYEMPDLAMFSQLVADLRQTEARRYTKSDAPLHTALHRPVTDVEGLWP